MSHAPRIARQLSERRDSIVASAVAPLRRPGLSGGPGRASHGTSESDVDQHLHALIGALAVSSRILFADYAAWAEVAFRAHGADERAVTAALTSLKRAIGDILAAPDAVLVNEFIDAGIMAAKHPRQEDSYIDEATATGARAQKILQCLLRADRPAALALVSEAIGVELDIRSLYMDVITPIQNEVGRLWQQNSITVEQEHFCTAAVLQVMSTLYPSIAAAERSRGTIVIAVVPSELHSVGSRMVADLLHLDGWASHLLIGSASIAGLLRATSEKRPDVVGISVSMTRNLPEVTAIIDSLRSSVQTSETPVLVGGRPFNLDPDLRAAVGADRMAASAVEAVTTARTLGVA